MSGREINNETAASGRDPMRQLAAVRHPGERVSPWRMLALAAGILTLLLLLPGSLRAPGDGYRLSVHMTRYVVLTMIATPLLIAGAPGWLQRSALRNHTARVIALRITTGPAAFAIFNVTLIAWHLPPLHDSALTQPVVRVIQQLCFLLAAVLMWWPIMSRVPEIPPLSREKQMLYIVLMTLPMTVVAMIIAYASTLLYPAYDGAPPAWGLSPVQDQRFAGLVLGIPSGFIYIAVLSVVFFKWVGETEREDRKAMASITAAPESATRTGM